MLKKNIYNHLKFTGKSPNIHEFLINLFFFLLVCIIFYWKNLQYDFTFFTDQDHVHIFEALTFNSLKEQKYFDHPGTICFIMLGIWLKILDFLNVISFSDLKYSNYDAKTVMKKFKESFLDSPKAKQISLPDYLINYIAHIKMGYFYIRHKIYNHYYKFIASKLIY